jgi:hypothetical protein
MGLVYMTQSAEGRFVQVADLRRNRILTTHNQEADFSEFVRADPHYS